MAGIYIHIPFCKQACHYCNFHFSTNLKSKKTILEKEPLESLAKKSQLKAFKHKSFWYSIDTKRDKENLEILIKNKKIPWNNFNHK